MDNKDAADQSLRNAILADVIEAQRVTIAALAVLFSTHPDKEALADAFAYWLPQLSAAPNAGRPGVMTMTVAPEMRNALTIAAKGAYVHPRRR